MKIGITGAKGMIGWHLRCHLKQYTDHAVVIADRRTFSSREKLSEFVRDVQFVVHLAGQNRGRDSEVSDTNPGLARQLVQACEDADVRPHIIYASSTHIYSDTIYGQSKKQAGETVADWAAANNSVFTNLILPHVFGEGTRPFYNSAVATFAHQLAIGDEPTVHNDSDLELVHAQEVSAEILRIMKKGEGGDIRVSGRKITVRHVLEKLRLLAESYSREIVPDLREPFDLMLFNLYRSYLFPGAYPRSLQLHSDERGALVEGIKNLNGGQAFFSTTRPGVTRGDHFHYRKVERFLVVQGSATIRVRRLFDDRVHKFDVCGEEPRYIDMPPLHTHNITNTGTTDLLTLFWSNEIFDPEAPDTVFEPVENAAKAESKHA